MASAVGMIYRITAIAATAVLLCWFAADAAAISGRRLWQTGEMTLVFDRRIQPLADEVNRYFPLVKQELEQTFGWALEIPPTVVLIADKNDFQRIVADPLFVAVAIPTRNTIVIDISRAQTEPRSLRIILAHELTHLLLHQHIRGARLPRWLDEGVCQWFTYSQLGITLEELQKLWQKKLSGRAIWWARAVSHLYPVLFFVAAVLTVAGFVLRRARRRREYESELDGDFENFEV
jgi:hypothetical protein